VNINNGALEGVRKSTYSLPERQEDDKLDGCHFEKWLVLGEIRSELDVELDEAVHGHCDADSFDHHDLDHLAGRSLKEGDQTYPNMRKGWTHRLQAISASSLSNECYQRHEDPNEAVLENTKPDNL